MITSHEYANTVGRDLIVILYYSIGPRVNAEHFFCFEDSCLLFSTKKRLS